MVLFIEAEYEKKRGKVEEKDRERARQNKKMNAGAMRVRRISSQ